MLKSPQLGQAQRAVIALFVCLAVWLAWQSKYSSRCQPTKCNAASQSTTSDETHKRHSAFWNWITSDSTGFFTFWLVVIGATQAGLFLWQLRYMRKGIEDARIAAEAAKASAETAKEQVEVAKAQIEVTKIGIFDLERAYLDAGPSEIKTGFVTDPPPPVGFFKPGDPMEVVIKIDISNTGRTRASLTHCYGEFSKGSLGERPFYNAAVGTLYLTDLSFAAGQKGTFPHVFRTRRVGEQFFFGLVEYKDIFKKTHTSRFCMRIVPSLENGKDGKMQFAGNDSWRECD